MFQQLNIKLPLIIITQKERFVFITQKVDIQIFAMVRLYISRKITVTLVIWNNQKKKRF
jgi:hypothetical protein